MAGSSVHLLFFLEEELTPWLLFTLLLWFPHPVRVLQIREVYIDEVGLAALGLVQPHVLIFRGRFLKPE